MIAPSRREDVACGTVFRDRKGRIDGHLHRCRDALARCACRPGYRLRSLGWGACGMNQVVSRLQDIAEQPVRRLRGDRFVTGAIRYLDDQAYAGCLHAVFLRSPHAHARIRSIDVQAAREFAGVHAALTGFEARDLIGPLVCMTPAPLTGTTTNLNLPCLPVDLVRYAGEPVAVVVAESEPIARHAATLIDVDYEVLTPMLDVAAATSASAVRQHPELPTNVVMAAGVSEGDCSAALDSAPRLLEGTVRLGRANVVPLEPRGCVAAWDANDGRLVVRVAIQQPHALRADLARQLKMAESDIQVIPPSLGGAFGFKFTGLPEEPLTCLMAVLLKRAVRWVETRSESLLIGARDYTASYRVGFDAGGRVLALAVDLDANIGALCASPGPLMPIVAATTFPGPYHIANLSVAWRAVMTNKGPWNGARGFGKEATCMVLESAMDGIAADLGIDPIEVRRKNLLKKEQFPHRTSTMTLDSGDYHRALDLVLELSDYHRKRLQTRTAIDPLKTGIGVAFELMPEGFDGGGSLARGFETATVRIDTSGFATVLTGVTSPGTGSDTAIAQLVSSQIGIPVEHVRVVQGDTDLTPYGAGSFSSRAVLVGGTAAWLAAGDLREKLAGAAGALLGAGGSDIEVVDGLYRVAKDPARCIPVGALIFALRSLGSALPGMESPQLESTRTYGPSNLQSIPDATGRMQIYPTYAYAVHVSEVEVDTETGVVRLVSHSAVHDCGAIINRQLVESQFKGAIAMGIGVALTEEERYDLEGHPLSKDFKTYLLPRIKDLPTLKIGHLVSPSPFSELGTKGAGETGLAGAAAAVVAAIRDAVGCVNASPTETPMTPPRVLVALDDVQRGIQG